MIALKVGTAFPVGVGVHVGVGVAATQTSSHKITATRVPKVPTLLPLERVLTVPINPEAPLPYLAGMIALTSGVISLTSNLMRLPSALTAQGYSTETNSPSGNGISAS